eukprot:gene4161-biopygen1534
MVNQIIAIRTLRNKEGHTRGILKRMMRTLNPNSNFALRVKITAWIESNPTEDRRDSDSDFFDMTGSREQSVSRVIATKPWVLLLTQAPQSAKCHEEGVRERNRAGKRRAVTVLSKN